MKKEYILFFLLFLAVALSGCATMFADVRIMQAERSGQLRVGMTLDQVAQIVGRQPNSYSDIIRTETDSSGTYTIWEVNGYSRNLNWSRVYYFKFKNGYLEAWGSH